MKTYHLLLFLLIAVTISCRKEAKQKIVENKTTILKGCVIGRDSDTIYLFKDLEDERFDEIAIPIINYEFEYEFEPEHIEMYQLVFEEEHLRGGPRILFFSEPDTIHFELHASEDYKMNKISGSEVNQTYNIYKNEILNPTAKQEQDINRIFDSIPYSNVNSNALNLLMSKLPNSSKREQVAIYEKRDDLIKKGLHMSEFGKEIDAKMKKIRNVFLDKKYQFIIENPSEVSYSLLLSDMQGLKYNEVPKEKIVEAYNTLSAKFPNHPYSELAQNLWIGYTELQPGGEYINFKAPDINNVYYELKPIVDKNQIVLLDLWATWCGPCIVKSRKIRPVYETYKDKGFAIVGVAGEFKNLNAYNKFMAKEQWPWLNLIELDRENKIWEKYNVMNGSGGMFLIDGSGEILAVDPTAEEVETILKDKLVNNSIKL